MDVGHEPVGIAVDSATGNVYVTDSGSGTVTVLAPVYSVTFSETGLPAQTQWSVTLNGTSGSSASSQVCFIERGGTAYAFRVGVVPGFSPVPRSGSILVHGSGVHVAIAFVPTTYPVRFIETGLPGGTLWWVSLAGATNNSTGPSIGFVETNATGYLWVSWTSLCYGASPSRGTLQVGGVAVNVSISFHAAVCTESGPPPVTVFRETGLRAGTYWSATLGGTTENSTTNQINFSVWPGNYAYSVHAVSGYTSDLSSGTLNVTAAGSLTEITFSPTFLGLPQLEGYALVGGIAGFAAVLGTVLVWQRKRTPPPQP